MEHWLSLRNLRAASLALLILLYSTIALSTASVKYFETINRVTVQKIFDESLLGSTSADSLAALGLVLSLANLISRPSILRIATSIVIFVTGTILYLTASHEILKVIGAMTVPSLAAFFISTNIVRRKYKDAGSILFAVRAFLFRREVKEEARTIIRAILTGIILLEAIATTRWLAAAFFYPTDVIYNSTDLFSQITRLESAFFHSLGMLSPILLILISFSFAYKWYISEAICRIQAYLSKQSQRKNNSDNGQVAENDQTKPIIFAEDKNTAERDSASYLIRQHDLRYNKKIGLIPDNASTTARGKRSSPLCTTSPSPIKKRIFSNAMLVSALFISILITIFPHLPAINPTGVGVSTDEQYYVNWMNKLRSQSAVIQNNANTKDDPFSIIQSAFTINKGDRPLTLLIILSLSTLTGLPDIVIIRYLPLVLAPLLVLATYLFLKYTITKISEGNARQIEDDHSHMGQNVPIDPKFCASIAAIFAAFSPQIVVGVYAGFLANWIAIVLAYLMLYYIIKNWKSDDLQKTIAYSTIIFGLSLLIMLVHVYTWEYLLAFIAVFSILSYIFARNSVAHTNIKVLILLIIICTTLVIDYYSKSQIVDNYQTAIGANSAVVKNIENVQDQESILSRLSFTLHTYVGGFLSNPAVFLLVLPWAVGANPKRVLDRILLSMLFMISMPILIGSVEFQTRLIYNMPFQMPAALIAASLVAIPRSASLSETRWQVNNRILLVIAVTIMMACFAIRAMVNLYLITPEGYTLHSQFLLP